VAELRASRARLVAAADADRRCIERDLHEGVQQHLVSLAVNLQLASQRAEADPAGAKAHLEEVGHDVQRALDETARLAQRIYPPLLDAGGLRAALRAAAASAGVPARVEVATGSGYPHEVAGTVYFSCLDALGSAGSGARATVTVRDEDGELAFEVVRRCDDDTLVTDVSFERIRDRVEALGGRLTVDSASGATRVSGSLPLSR
jgi:signal transduction histidine kinase